MDCIYIIKSQKEFDKVKEKENAFSAFTYKEAIDRLRYEKKDVNKIAIWIEHNRCTYSYVSYIKEGNKNNYPIKILNKELAKIQKLNKNFLIFNY